MKYLFKPTKKKKIVILILGIIVLILIADYFVEIKQTTIIKEKVAKIKKLEEQAFYMLSADIRDIKETEDIETSNKYEVLLRIDNVADEPIFISHPYVKAFVQTGTISWTEVPVLEKENNNIEQIYRIDEEGQSVFRRIIIIKRDLPYNEYLIRKYMHVKFFIVMYVLPESGFKEGEVVERRSGTHVYLKPFYLSDEEIREVIDFGDTKVPVYMPITSFRKWTPTIQ